MITKAKWLKMKLTSVLYVLNLKKKSSIRVVVSTKGWKYRASHKWKVRATKLAEGHQPIDYSQD